MATGPQHYAEIDVCLDAARRASDKGRDEDAAFWQREAQVHATAAMAAATALAHFNFGTSFPEADRTAWYQAASEGAPAQRAVSEITEGEVA